MKPMQMNTLSVSETATLLSFIDEHDLCEMGRSDFWWACNFFFGEERVAQLASYAYTAFCERCEL